MFLKILILLALVMEEKEIALAALGVIVTLSQRPPPDTPVPPSNTELPTCLAGV